MNINIQVLDQLTSRTTRSAITQIAALNRHTIQRHKWHRTHATKVKPYVRIKKYRQKVYNKSCHVLRVVSNFYKQPITH